MLYEPAEFEPLTDEPWDPARVEAAFAAIVSDADAAFDPEALWLAHEWDGWEEPLPLKNLYVGAAGLIWACETGPLLVAFRLASDPALADDLDVLVRANVANPTDDVEWGAPGTLLAALARGEMDRRAALGGGSARVGPSPARTPGRRRALRGHQRRRRPSYGRPRPARTGCPWQPTRSARPRSLSASSGAASVSTVPPPRRAGGSRDACG